MPYVDPELRSARFSVRISSISRRNEQSARTSHLNAGLALRSCDPFARDRCFGVVARAQQVGSVPCVRRHLCVVARERAKMPRRGPSGTFAPLEWGRCARRIAPLRLSGRPLACASTTPHVPRHPSGARMLPMWKQNRSRVRAVYYSITGVKKDRSKRANGAPRRSKRGKDDPTIFVRGGVVREDIFRRPPF